MKHIDIIGQTVILLATIAATLPFDWSAVLIGEFAIGVWQMVSCTLALMLVKPFRNLRAIHFTLAIIYLIVFTAGFTNEVMMWIAWALAAFYYIITWKWFLYQPKQGNFLPHVSF